MQVSREYAVAELKSVVGALSAWVQDLETPTAVDQNGHEHPIYPDGVPVALSIAEMEGIPAHQLRAELLAIAGKLEALASV